MTLTQYKKNFNETSHPCLIAMPCYLSCQESQAAQENLDVPAIHVILVLRKILWNPWDQLALLALEVPALCGSVHNFSVGCVGY